MAKHSKRKREEKHEEEDVDGSSVDDNRSESSGGAGESEEEPPVDEAHSRDDDQLPLNANGGDDDVSDDGGAKERKKKKKVRKLSLKKTQDFNAKLRKRGVLYIARIPPRMGPAKVKTLLSEFGPVTRVYLVEEDRSARKRRRKLAGGAGAGGKRYTEGWVEFEDKKVARLVGERLNNTPITNHKRSVHFGDLWNVKYLRKFKWEHLTEKVAYERRIREQKMRIEMMQARRENAAYAEKVEQGMVLDRIEERRKKKGKSVDRPKGRKDRKFRQTSTVEEGASGPAKKAVLGSLV